MSILAVHAAATLAMAGLIWFVQIVHYPLMAAVGHREFVSYEQAHTRRTTSVVGPLMLAEAATAGMIAVATPDFLRLAGVALLGVIWLSTAALQVPLHRRLSSGKDDAAIAALVRGNWIRTVAWTVRGVIALALLA